MKTTRLRPSQGSDDDAMREQHRAALVRALTAQAWAVACMAWWTEEWAQGFDDEKQYSERNQAWVIGIKDASTRNVQRLSALPAPADLAAEILGGDTVDTRGAR